MERNVKLSYSFPFEPGTNTNIIELGGGNQPYFRPNLDVREGENIDIVADFNEPLPLPNNEYDGVFSSFCIEHLSWRKVRLFLQEIYRILKNNGKVVFITANTERQMQHVLEQEEWNDDSSCIIFGDQNYPENTHRNSLCPRYAVKLLQEEGFSNIITLPFGALSTDMIIEATKVHETFDKNYFNRSYFDNPNYFENPQDGLYKDHPQNWIIFNKIMQMKPTSVLELGCGRGYLLKKFESAGLPAKGLDFSRHCQLTRVTNNVLEWDICNTPWPFKDKEFDLCISNSVLQFIDDKKLPDVLKEIERVCHRGLHGVDSKKMNPNGKDIIDKDELKQGSLALSIPAGDGKTKLNFGSFIVMFHHGWINLDIINLTNYAIENQYKFAPCDARQRLGFDDNSVDLIYTSHMLEHLSYQDGLNFLKECFRIMKSGAVMRVTVPDIEKMVDLYKTNRIHELDEINIVASSNKSEAFKLFAYVADNHLMFYDWKTLEQIGKEAGFMAKRKGFNESDNPQMAKETMDFLPEISIYVEFTKP